jgi:hypothetical protein
MLIQELACLDSNIAGQLLLIEFCNTIGQEATFVPSEHASLATIRSVETHLAV